MLLIVVIPAIVMMLMGYFVGANSKEAGGIDLSPMIENEDYGTSGVIIAKGRVSSHPVTRYGNLYFEMDAECFWHAAGNSLSEGEYIEDGKIGIIIKRPGGLRVKRSGSGAATRSGICTTGPAAMCRFWIGALSGTGQIPII